MFQFSFLIEKMNHGSTHLNIIHPCLCGYEECPCNPQLSNAITCPCHLVLRDAIFKDNYMELVRQEFNKHYQITFRGGDSAILAESFEDAGKKITEIRSKKSTIYFSGQKYDYSYDFKPLSFAIVFDREYEYMVKMKTETILTIFEKRLKA